MAKFTRILSIDGGGIRGIIPGQVLVQVEKLLQQESGDPSARLADHFDLIAGTSTGGILTCCYLCPDDSGTRPRYSAEEAVALYLERGGEIFSVPFWHRLRSVDGVLDEKYPADGLQDTLKAYLGEVTMDRLLGECLITSYDIERRRTHFFTRTDARHTDSRNFKVREVARATSAAPTFFEVAAVTSESSVRYSMVDGGVFANNPTLCAYAEAREFPTRPKAKDMVILSLGTGENKKPYEYRHAKNWGALEWVVPVLDIMMSGVSETVHYQLDQIYDAVGRPEQYLRVQTVLSEAQSAMDDARSDNMRALKRVGQELADDNEDKLRATVRLLLQQ